MRESLRSSASVSRDRSCITGCHVSCPDPMIPLIPALTPVSPFGDADSCYDVCDLVQKDNCTTGPSDRDCMRLQRSSTAEPSPDRQAEPTSTTTTTTTTQQQSPHVLPMDQADDETDDDDTSSDLQDDVDDELENSSSLTTESVRVRRWDQRETR